MDDRHLSIELLRAIHRGERSPGDLAAVAMAHLFEKCSQCRETFEAWRRELGEGTADPFLSRYDSAFDRVKARLRGEDTGLGCATLEEQVEIEASDAQQLLTEILSHPPAERADVIRHNRRRYSGPVLADLLLDEARAQLPGKPRDSYTWASLARAVLQHSSPTPFAVELYARALAHQANALRAQGDLRSASEILDVSRYILRSQGGGDSLTRAELDSFEGSLRRAQRRFEDSKEMFSRATMAYAIEGRRTEAANNLMPLGSVLAELGEYERAVDVAAQALEIAQEERLPDLELFARHNLAFTLYQAGAYEEARRLFDESAPLFEKYGDPPIRLRRIWLGGHLARAEERLDEAEAAYTMVRDGFLRQGIAYHAAVATLDLAMLYAEQRRMSDLKRIAEEIVPIFESQDVHREAAAALMLFQDAVRAEQVTLRYLVELSRYLERARLDPSLAFQRPA